MGEGNVDACHLDEARQLLLLVVVDRLPVFEDASDCLDKRDELIEVLLEFRGIGDREDDVGLRLLGKAAPAVSVIKVTNKRSLYCVQDIALDVVEVKLRRGGWCSHD